MKGFIKGFQNLLKKPTAKELVQQNDLKKLSTLTIKSIGRKSNLFQGNEVIGIRRLLEILIYAHEFAKPDIIAHFENIMKQLSNGNKNRAFVNIITLYELDEKAKIAVAQFLIQINADPHAETLSHLIQRKGQVQYYDDKNYSSFEHAIRMENLSILDLICKLPAHAPTRVQLTKGLEIAIECHNYLEQSQNEKVMKEDIIPYLIKQGVDYNIETMSEYSELFAAAEKPKVDLKIKSALEEHLVDDIINVVCLFAQPTFEKSGKVRPKELWEGVVVAGGGGKVRYQDHLVKRKH